MSVELLQILSVVAYILAGICLLLAVILFFLFDIPKLYGLLSGRTAKKAIEAIRKKNEETQAQPQAKVPRTDKITPSGRISPATAELPNPSPTAKLSTARLQGVVPDRPIETTVLSETTVLPAAPPVNGETTLLSPETPTFGETTLLSPEAPTFGETTLPVSEPEAPPHIAPTQTFTLEVCLYFLGSDEVIE